VSRIVAIGEETLLEGYALAGVSVTAAPDAGSVLEAWSALEPGDAELVILTRAARDALGAALSAESGIGWVVLPE
jgi:vacuolar-type H+-ATPase subunit F/Vma7